MVPVKTLRRIASILVILSAGCGDEDDAVALVPVKGTITSNGEPLANAQVTFFPDPSNKDQTTGGDVSGPAGTYLARYKSRSGLAPGKYKVVVEPGEDLSEAKVDSAAQEAFKDDPIMLQETRRNSAAANRPRKKRPEPKSEFPAEVEASGSRLDFDLKKAAAAVSKTDSR